MKSVCTMFLLAGSISLFAVSVVTSRPLLENARPASPPDEITIVSTPPSELNPQGGGAPKASFEQAAQFAWEEFIALNWPAGPQNGKPGQRDTPSSTCRFGDPSCGGPVVWQTFRGKVEIFPGNHTPPDTMGNAMYGPPPGYPGSQGDASWGYDSLPTYNYQDPVPACDANQNTDPAPWVNLDETDQITLDNMYAGVVDPNSSPGNSSPQLIRFLAKANRVQYTYVARNSDPKDRTKQWWGHIPRGVVNQTKNYLMTNEASPPQDSSQYVSLPNGTIEIKAAWRPLNPAETASGRFHAQTVRFYELGSNGNFSRCYRDAIWGLVALHIIQKTPTAPYFIYATFEQADNILTTQASAIEDAEGNIVASPEPPTPTTPQTCLKDPPPPMTSTPAGGEITSNLGSVIVTADPTVCAPVATPSYCGAPGPRLYLRNSTGDPPNSEPSDGNICIDKRENAIPDYAIAANRQAHASIRTYLGKSGIMTAPWLYYKLVNVQYYPYDKLVAGKIPTPNGSLYAANPPFSATNPPPSSFYQANIVVETNRSLQLFSGGLSPNISSDWNQDGKPHKNTYYGGHFYNMGGCLGCHGSQGQNPNGLAGDFSVILARGAVIRPEIPAIATSQGMTTVPRNRSLTR
jgi:hypothetical protein